MDALNEEFAKLEFLGGFPPCSSVYGSKSSDGGAVENSALTNNVQHCRVSIIKDSHTGHYNTNPSGLSPKKAGPTVPPKPQKNVKLQETDGAHYNYGHMIQYSSLCSHPRLLHRKQSTLGSKASCNKMKEFTLDNPAILDQQLEALAHHKMQLEKKGILQKSPVALSACRDPSSHLDALKVSLSSLPSHPKNNSSNGRLKTTAPCPDSSNILLSNPCTASHLTKKTIIKTADETKNGTVSNMYHNTNCENDRLENFASPLTTLNIGTEECLKNIDGTIPPSPVSSSYSELHRATDIFSKISALTTPQKQEVCHNSNNHLITGAKASNLSYSKFNETPSERNCDVPNSVVYQNYMSMNYNNEYVNFNDSSSSQGSSTYESIYEPITPRPSSQLSARSNYLMYVQYANSPQTSNSGIVDSSGNLSSWTAAGGTEKTKLSAGLNSGSSMKHHISKEPEMEALTDYLVHSVDSANDVYSYGVCVKCNERVVGEKSGCTAMGQVYHISCFTCSQCQVNLQGKPFYALECKPYCEYDYLQTLEKCSICTKPILERILRATGKPYHPQCFTCVVCGNSLDGIPFTVDATNQNYCIADFHKKFAPRCCVCEQPIMPEPGQEETVRVVALDRSFHFDCYKCEDCGLLLSSEAEGRGCYPLDDHVLCKSCNAKRVQLLTNRMTTKL